MLRTALDFFFRNQQISALNLSRGGEEQHRFTPCTSLPRVPTCSHVALPTESWGKKEIEDVLCNLNLKILSMFAQQAAHKKALFFPNISALPKTLSLKIFVAVPYSSARDVNCPGSFSSVRQENSPTEQPKHASSSHTGHFQV